MSELIVLGDCSGEPVLVDPHRIIDGRMLGCANSGGGKSWMLRRIIEQVASHLPVIIVDPEGEFSTLREEFDFVLVGGESGDVPVSTSTARVLCLKLMEAGVSAVLDISELDISDRCEFVRLFFEQLMAMPKQAWRPTMFVIDEAHKFCPERGSGSASSAHAIERLMSQGRKRGYGGVLVTQRLSKLAKNVVGECNTVLLGRCVQDVDQRRAADLLGISTRESKKLRDLEPGSWFGFGPAFVDRDFTESPFTVGEVKTTHPNAGVRHTLALRPPRRRESLADVLAAFADLSTDPEQLTDPSADGLRARLVAVEADLAAARADERARIQDAVLDAVAANNARWKARLAQLLEADEPKHVEPKHVEPKHVEPKHVEPKHVEPKHVEPKPKPKPKPTGDLKPIEIKILSALALYGDLTKERLRAVTGVATKGGHYNTVSRRLKDAGYMTTSGKPELLSITPGGISAIGAEHEPPPRAGAERLAFWRSKVAAMQRSLSACKIFDAMVSARAEGRSSLSKGELGEATGLATAGGNWNSAIARLRNMGLLNLTRGRYRLNEDLYQ